MAPLIIPDISINGVENFLRRPNLVVPSKVACRAVAFREGWRVPREQKITPMIRLRFAQDDKRLAPRHHLKKKTPEVFGFRNCRQNWLIWRLLESTDSARGAPCINKAIGNRL